MDNLTFFWVGVFWLGMYLADCWFLFMLCRGASTLRLVVTRRARELLFSRLRIRICSFCVSAMLECFVSVWIYLLVIFIISQYLIMRLRNEN